jgi:sialic acid synthase SpsE
MKRPGDGISPMRMAEIVGKKALYTIPEDHKISLEDIE